jgi:preprotein translocase subunit SecA
VADVAQRLMAASRAVLIGTRSVGASEQLAAVLSQRGVAHALLNAKQDRAEADVIAAAGQPGRVTVATNMAGRGTDIQLDAWRSGRLRRLGELPAWAHRALLRLAQHQSEACNAQAVHTQHASGPTSSATARIKRETRVTVRCTGITLVAVLAAIPPR